MRDCWKENPKSRPTFTSLVERMSTELETFVESVFKQFNISLAKD